jgi:hypothetical protein
MSRAVLPSLVLGIFLFILTGSVVADDYGFRVMRAELVPLDDQYVLNADIDYRFSDPAIDALKNGVPLTLVLRVKIYRDSAFWWSRAEVNERREFRVRYHSLTKLFQLVQEESGALHNFVSFNALLEYMGAIRGLPVVPAERIHHGERYRARVAVDLDIESLPLPLRPVAYVTPAWYLSSPWYRWSFAG